MQKKLLLGLATVATISAAAAVGNTADATTHDNTDTSISFYGDNKPNPGPFGDNLSLAWVPTEFNFGNNKVDASSLSTAKVYSQQIDASAKQYIAVSDDRATKTNWQVKANLDDFVDATDATNTLENAELTFTLGEVQAYNIDIDKSDQIKAATPNPAEPGALEALDATLTSAFSVPALGTQIKLVAGSTASLDTLAYTNATNVEETVAVAREVSSVKLKVLNHENVKDKSFSSNVHWNLTSEPEL